MRITTAFNAIFTLFLLCGVYVETGIFTAASITLIAITLSINTYLIKGKVDK
jgi:hypothetical protein